LNEVDRASVRAIAGVALQRKRLGARFSGKHECKRSRNNASDDAGPKRNEDAVHGHVPAQGDAQQLQQRYKRENDNGDGGKGFHS